jgi:hypothetical protein
VVVSFALDADIAHPLDFALIRDGGVAMYWRTSVLDDTERELASLGYDLVRMDATAWGEAVLHRDFAASLGFPTYYGSNLNALGDCLGEVAHGDYGWDSSATGLAVSVRGFAHLVRRDVDLARVVADALTKASRQALLFGHRLISLLQVDDGTTRVGPVGGFAVPWNSQEWLDSSRQ